MDAHEVQAPARAGGNANSRARAVVLLVVLLLAAGCSKSNDSGVIAPTATVSTVPTTPAAHPTTTTTTATATPTKSPTPSAKPSVTASVAPKVTPTVQVSETSGATKSLKKGDFMSLSLTEDAGFVWEFSATPDPAILAVVSDQSISANGRHKWTFQAVGTGTTTFTVIEKKPSDVSPLHNYVLTVAVS